MVLDSYFDSSTPNNRFLKQNPSGHYDRHKRKNRLTLPRITATSVSKGRNKEAETAGNAKPVLIAQLVGINLFDKLA